MATLFAFRFDLPENKTTGDQWVKYTLVVSQYEKKREVRHVTAVGGTHVTYTNAYRSDLCNVCGAALSTSAPSVFCAV